MKFVICIFRERCSHVETVMKQKGQLCDSLFTPANLKIVPSIRCL